MQILRSDIMHLTNTVKSFNLSLMYGHRKRDLLIKKDKFLILGCTGGNEDRHVVGKHTLCHLAVRSKQDY